MSEQQTVDARLTAICRQLIDQGRWEVEHTIPVTEHVPAIYTLMLRNMLIEEVNRYCDRLTEWDGNDWLGYHHERIKELEEGRT